MNTTPHVPQSPHAADEQGKRASDPCEYNPEAKRAAYENECHAQADVIVGANGEWRLCSKCAALPEFKKYRSVRPIRRDSK